MTVQRDEPRGTPRSGEAAGWQENDHGPNSNIPMPDPGLMSRSRVENMINVARHSGRLVLIQSNVSSQVTP